jgi:hypothetical protein
MPATALPATIAWTGAAVTEGGFKTAQGQLRDYLSFLFGDDGTKATAIATLGASPFPAGTLMLFAQTSAPTGWTKSTTHNDKALRVVSGTAGSGGAVAFSTAFGRTATDSHTLDVTQIPSHAHTYTSGFIGNPASVPIADVVSVNNPSQTGFVGGGLGHSHNIDLRVNYVDVIIASKDA